MKIAVLIVGIQIKIEQGANLEDILTSYVNLSEDEKQEIRQKV